MNTVALIDLIKQHRNAAAIEKKQFIAAINSNASEREIAEMKAHIHECGIIISALELAAETIGLNVK